jgi:toxin secretion/phage lysis holin
LNPKYQTLPSGAYEYITFRQGSEVNGVAALLDRVIDTDEHVVRDTVCWFYIANEGISIMENLMLAGVPFPKFLKKIFDEKLKADAAIEDEDTTEY